MFDNNIIMQTSAILSLFIVVGVLILTFIPSTDFEVETDNPNIFRAILVILILGLVRGAF